MTPRNFLSTARELAGTLGRGRPRETNLRRAVSTTYYALFHCLAVCCADMIVGGSGSSRSVPAWRQAYRALRHGTVRQRCERSGIIARFPSEIQDFAEQFVDMQKKRHTADYDPYAMRNPITNFVKSDVIQDILVTEGIIHRFNQCPARDRRAFAVYVLLDVRND